jgi:hypothetical protein
LNVIIVDEPPEDGHAVRIYEYTCKIWEAIVREIGKRISIALACVTRVDERLVTSTERLGVLIEPNWVGMRDQHGTDRRQ